ncbi:MAG: sulfotransferase [Bauldia sp.]|uniref:sulfotransferase n=1 Tax=Bauldia sp. TaxID=2575872 RepID=UPI001D875FAF|nr:sulfotransferase [Bauldia sp.]MCB1496450.1 sulfotransferase [Bauldia sp.]
MKSHRGVGPDFVCIGAQKAGTQWLYDQLAWHPRVWMPPIKELHCLDEPDKQAEKAADILHRLARNPARYNEKQRRKHRPPVEPRDIDFLVKLVDMPPVVDIERYCALFDGKGDAVAGDITPAYSTLEPDLIARLGRRLPDLKIVFIARDPVERLWSQYSMLMRKDQTPVIVDPGAVIAFASLPEVVRRSFPSRIVSGWRRFFPPEQVGVFFFDELRANAHGLRKKILNFLGLDDRSLGEDIDSGRDSKRNQKRYDLTEEIRLALEIYFHDELRRCADDFGGPALGWGRQQVHSG